MIGRCRQLQLFRSELPDTLPIHSKAHCARSGNDPPTLSFQLDECLRSDCLDLRNDKVGLFFFNNCTDLFPVEHGEYMATVCDVHSWSAFVSIACDHLHPEPCRLYGDLFAQLSGAEEQNLFTRERCSHAAS